MHFCMILFFVTCTLFNINNITCYLFFVFFKIEIKMLLDFIMFIKCSLLQLPMLIRYCLVVVFYFFTLMMTNWLDIIFV